MCCWVFFTKLNNFIGDFHSLTHSTFSKWSGNSFIHRFCEKTPTGMVMSLSSTSRSNGSHWSVTETRMACQIWRQNCSNLQGGRLITDQIFSWSFIYSTPFLMTEIESPWVCGELPEKNGELQLITYNFKFTGRAPPCTVDSPNSKKFILRFWRTTAPTRQQEWEVKLRWRLPAAAKVLVLTIFLQRSWRLPSSDQVFS